MSLLSGSINARRFYVPGSLQPDWREMYRDKLEEHAFRNPPVIDKAEYEGWVKIDDMLETNFENLNTWLIGSEYIAIGLRVDKRVLPAAKFKAELGKRIKAWCEESGSERCPREVKAEIKEMLEAEWLSKTIPRTKVHQVIWNLGTNIVYTDTHSDVESDRIRKRFFRTFGRKLNLHSPLLWVSLAFGEETAHELLHSVPFQIKFEAVP